MSQITSQKAAQAIGGQYKLVLAASQRARQLDKQTVFKNKKEHGIVIRALQDIEDGLYSWEDYLRDKK